MRLLDEKSQISSAVKRWVSQYGLDHSYGADLRGRSVGKELMELNVEVATASDVAEIIGNDSWVCEEFCDECGSKTWQLVELGEDPFHESRTAWICRGCLVAAIALIDGVDHV